MIDANIDRLRALQADLMTSHNHTSQLLSELERLEPHHTAISGLHPEEAVRRTVAQYAGGVDGPVTRHLPVPPIDLEDKEEEEEDKEGEDELSSSLRSRHGNGLRGWRRYSYMASVWEEQQLKVGLWEEVGGGNDGVVLLNEQCPHYDRMVSIYADW